MSRLLDGLNPRQREAVEHTEGPLLVLAGAGSGKTRVITRRIAYILEQGLATPQQILAVTFTNKAAREMRERVADIVGDDFAKGIVLSTFHSFCVRVLRQEIEHIGYRKNFTISSEGDARTLVRRVIDDVDGVKESFSPDMFHHQIGMLKNAGLAPDAAAAGVADTETKEKYQTWLPEIYDRYQSALRAANMLDFDDLLGLTVRLWQEHPKVLARFQQRFKYVMVDEYQDTNGIQYKLLRELVRGHGNLCVVGDDDQSIYGWRGAEVRKILNFERDFPGAKVVTLDQNYRSTETILKAANHVIANNSTRHAKKLWSDLGKGRPIDWIVTGDEEQEAKTVVSWLQHIRGRTGARYNHFAVLYRSNQQSRPLEIAFRGAGIPYVVIGGQDFFERAEVRDIISYLKVLSNPRDEAAFLRIVNVPRRGIGDTTLHQIHDLCRAENLSFGKGMAEGLKRGLASKRAEAGIRLFLSLLTEYRRRLRERQGSLESIIQDLVTAIGYREELERTCKSDEQLMQRWANVEAVANAAANYEAGAEKPSLRGFLDASSLDTDDRFTKEERRQDGVTLMTIHSSKGLEFPFVFIVGAEEGLLPHERSLRDGTLEEERRLFYVAMTRGQRHVTLFEALTRHRNGKDIPTKTSRFIREIPDEFLNQRALASREMAEAYLAPDPKPKKKKKRYRKRQM